MSRLPDQHVWIFNGTRGRFPGGVFATRERAEGWIAENRLTGVLTAYPLDEGNLDWCLANGATGGSAEKIEARRGDPDFVGSFSSASQTHYHYEDGAR